MDKIYSRKRLLLPKLRKNRRGSNLKFRNNYGKVINNGINMNNNNVKNNQNNQNYQNNQNNQNNLNQLFQNNNIINKKLIKTAIIVIIAVFIANRIIATIEPTVNILCIDMAKAIATKVSNEQATIVMEKYKYDDISNVIKDDKGNIKMIQMNVITVNAITSDVALKIQDGLENYNSEEFSIKLGTFTGSKILSGRGPNVPIKMATVGNVETNLVSQFSQSGINQTLHRIYLNVSCNVTVLTPFDSIEQNIVNQVLIADAVIVGEVPSNYYNLNGIQSDDLIEFIE